MAAAQAKSLLLPHLETFSMSAELGSFTAAARVLHLTQAAVSQRIQALEKSLATPLFKRQGGRVLLTEAGQKLYDYAQQILELHRQARQEITGRHSPVAGELYIAASSIPGEYFLPALLSVFGRQHPEVRVHATVSDSMAVMAQVERGEASLGLVGRKADNPHLEFWFLAEDRMVLVVPPGHPLCRRRKISAAQLASYPLILREAGSGLRHCFERALEAAGHSLADLQIPLELGSNEAIKQAVLQGAGAAVLSICAVRQELQARRLCAVEVRDLHCDRAMYIVRDKRRVPSLPARSFLLLLETSPMPIVSS